MYFYSIQSTLLSPAEGQHMSLYSTVVLHLQKKLEKLQNKSNDKQLYLPSSSGIINRQKAHKYGKVQEIGTKLKEED